MTILARNLKAMTLVEMMVAIAIVLITMEGFTYLFLKTWDTNKFILEAGMASAAASRATNKVVIELRSAQQADNGAYPLKSGDDFNFVFYANVDGDPAVERVHYFLDLATDQLKVGVTDPTPGSPVSYPVADGTVSVVANYVVNENDNPVFYYYNENYPGDVVNNPLSTPVSVGNIRMVRVHLYVNINPVHAPDNINIESFVDLRNLNTYE